jgi:hypothetical protein
VLEIIGIILECFKFIMVLPVVKVDSKINCPPKSGKKNKVPWSSVTMVLPESK